MMIIMVLMWIAGILIALLAIHSGYRAVMRHRHAIASPGVDEAGYVEINGIRQYIQVRGKSANNPVLLVLHGGPGSPLGAMAHTFQYAWEEDYTVVQWDQRLAGKTFYANDEKTVAAALSFDMVLEDAWQVTQYLQKRFGVEKIAVLGHSWGTVLGTALVQTHPEAFSCYIGVGQVVNLQDNERVGYKKTLELARAGGNQKDIAALEVLADYPGDTFSDTFCQQMIKLRGYQQKYGLAETISLRNVMIVMSSPYYSFLEAMYYAKNTSKLHRPLFRYMFESYDVRSLGTTYQVPVYYIMGEHDYQTPVPLTAALFDEISAPQIQFFLVPAAGHFTMADNPAAFNNALLDCIRPTL